MIMRAMEHSPAVAEQSRSCSTSCWSALEPLRLRSARGLLHAGGRRSTGHGQDIQDHVWSASLVRSLQAVGKAPSSRHDAEHRSAELRHADASPPASAATRCARPVRIAAS